MIIMTAWAVSINLVNLYALHKWLLFRIGSMTTILQTWMVVEGVIVLARLRRKT